MINYIDKINNLKESPLFNLSLSSKELFHSNFIAWICENYAFEFGNIIASFFCVNTENNKIVSTSRELKKLDLIIELDSVKLIIENKVKSIPNRQQLIDYKNRNSSNDIYILLTLIKPNFNLDEIGWHLLSYKDLSNLICQLKDKISNEYHKAMINDYTNFINILSDLTDLINIDFNNDYFNFYSEKHELFKKVRLHDLYLKSTYDKLIYELQTYLKSKIKNYEVLAGKRYSHQINRNQIVISTTIVNGKGVVNIDYSDEDEIIYGVMLDKNRYNQYIYAWGDKAINITETADKLQNNNKWFKFSNVTEEEIYPKKSKKYNRFGNNMLYRSVKINNNQTLSSLFEQIYIDLKKII